MSTAIENVALPGLGPPPPEPVARSRDPEGALHELFGFEGFRRGPARGGGGGRGRARRAGGHAHRLGQVALLPAARAHAGRPHAGGLAAGLADAGPGGGGRAGGAGLRRPRQRAAGLVGQPAGGRARRRGDLRLLYVAPERFSSPGFLERIRHARIGLFVVDEAHCVSQWGHDFRPDYFRLADAARWLGAKAIMASTATATPQVAADIVGRLGLREPVRVATGFDRPNLSFAVVKCANKQAVHRGIAAALKEPGALPGIVYAHPPCPAAVRRRHNSATKPAPNPRKRGFALRTGRYGRPPMSLAIENVALPGLGPPPPEPVARSRDPEGALHELFGFAALPAGPARGGRGRGGEPRRAGGDAHRLGQVALLPAPRAHAGGPHARGLAAGLVDAGPGGGRRAGGARVRRAGQRAAGLVGQPAGRRARRPR